MNKQIFAEFMRSTFFEHMGESDQNRGLPAPPPMAILGQVEEKVALPSPADTGLLLSDLRALVRKRRSRRRYTEAPLTLPELAFLLWCTQGIEEAGERPASLRTVPSAGARHACETLIVVRRVEGLLPGLYQYDAFSHRLLRLPADADLAERVTAACRKQPCVADAAAVLLWVAIANRMTWRFGERGYRYLHLDAGHICQNLYLGVEALGLGTVAVAAFNDAALNDAFALDGEEKFVIYVAPVGRPVATND